MSRLLQPLVPGLDVKPLIAELRERMEEELDYRDEAANQRAFAEVFDGDQLIAVPRVVASAPRAMVSEWVSGRKLSDVIAGGTADERDQAGALLAEFHYCAPARVGPAARRPASRQLPAAARRAAAGARLRRGRPAARGPAPAAVGDDPARAGGPAGRPRRAAARRGIPAAGDDRDRRRPRSPTSRRSPSRCAPRPFHFTRRWLQSQAERVGDLRSSELRRRPPAEPAAAVPAGAPGDDGHARGAVPARRPGRRCATSSAGGTRRRSSTSSGRGRRGESASRIRPNTRSAAGIAADAGVARGMATKIVATAFGGPEVLSVVEAEVPQPGPGEVVIAVKAAGINLFDYKVISGAMGADPARLPLPVGLEVAGVVTAVGPDAGGPGGADRRRRRGGRSTRSTGGYADTVTAPASVVVPKPPALDWPVAGSILLGGRHRGARAAGGCRRSPARRCSCTEPPAASGRSPCSSPCRTASASSGPPASRTTRCSAATASIPVTYGPGLADRVRALAPEGVDAAIDTIGTDEAVDVSLELVADHAPDRVDRGLRPSATAGSC